MAIVKPGAKVLVSGANGFLAMWVVRVLLERGYSVRGTVRTEAKAAYIKDYFKSYGEKFEVVIVPDITKEGAFDDAVKGIDAVEHTSSPFHGNADDPNELIIPAVQGTVGMLQSALKYGTNVKRVVITSSCAAVQTRRREPTVFCEKDWNLGAIAEVEEKGKDAANMSKYQASKTLAEKAAWKFVKENKGGLKYDVTTINPPYVFGPPIHEVTSHDALNTSDALWYKNVVANTPKTREDLSFSGAWVDVRDIAEAHALALEKESAGGERIIVAAGSFIWQDFLDAANSLSPSPYPHKLQRGYADIERKYWIGYNTSKAANILGITYKTKEITTRDMLKDFASRGW